MAFRCGLLGAHSTAQTLYLGTRGGPESGFQVLFRKGWQSKQRPKLLCREVCGTITKAKGPLT